jgi:transcriptional regulator with XRE-family HTH domain
MQRKRPELLPRLIGQRVRELRKDVGVTQHTLAEKAEVSVDFVSRVERGVCMPSMARLTSIAKVLNVSLRDFFDSSLFSP